MRAILRTVSLVVGAVALFGTAPAQAATFCVHDNGCPQVDHNFETIGQAVNAAAGNDSPTPIKDTILVGAGEYDGFLNEVGHPIEVVGSGPTTVVRVAGDSASGRTLVTLHDGRETMRNLTVRLPAGGNSVGVFGGTLIGVDVRSAAPQTGSSTGVLGSRFEDGTIEVPGGTGATSSIVSRAVISAHIGLKNAHVEDSIVRVAGPGGVGLREGGPDRLWRVTHVDLLGDGSARTVAVDAVPEGFDTRVRVDSSIIRGFATNFVQTNNSNFADISVAYSDFDPAVPNQETSPGGVDTSYPGQNTAAAPGFVSASDPHLRFDSALVDRGNPSSPWTGDSTTDLGGLPRRVNGKGSGTPLVDIGAFEYQRGAPAISAETASPTTASVHEPVTFQGAATDPEGEAVTLTWDFGDGQSAAGTEVTHVFEAAGPHTVRLTARDASGVSSSADLALDVVNHPPELTVSLLPAAPLIGQIAAFHSVASDPDGEAVTVVWDFGDGTQATGSDPTHAYRAAGTKTVTATATDPQGLTAVQTLQVPVAAPPLTCRVPNLIGRSLTAARAAIRRAHCVVGKIVRLGHKRLPFVVRAQSPRAGRTVPAGTRVNLMLGP